MLESWPLPTHAVPSKDGITIEWNGLRFGYRFIRKISIEGPVLRSEYTLHNLAPFDFHFVWSMHALGSLHSPIELQMPGGTYRLSHDATGKRIDAPFAWPVTGAGEDLSHPENLPPKGGWKIFSQEPISSPVVVNYPQRKRSLKIEYASEDSLAAYWGLWISSGGWGWHKHFAVEPTAGRFDELDRSTKDGSAGVVPALGKLNWRVQWTVG